MTCGMWRREGHYRGGVVGITEAVWWPRHTWCGGDDLVSVMPTTLLV